MIKLVLSLLKNVRNIQNLTNQQHNAQLTQFLKKNEGFKSLSWKLFHFKKDIIKKLDETILDDDDNSKSKKKIHEIDFNKTKKK